MSLSMINILAAGESKTLSLIMPSNFIRLFIRSLSLIILVLFIWWQGRREGRFNIFAVFTGGY